MCLNVPRSRNTRREEPRARTGPVRSSAVPTGRNPEDEALLAALVGLALPVVLSGDEVAGPR